MDPRSAQRNTAPPRHWLQQVAQSPWGFRASRRTCNAWGSSRGSPEDQSSSVTSVKRQPALFEL
eukprot:12625504-Alexandrium_andersonii.AAC.1